MGERRREKEGRIGGEGGSVIWWGDVDESCCLWLCSYYSVSRISAFAFFFSLPIPPLGRFQIQCGGPGQCCPSTDWSGLFRCGLGGFGLGRKLSGLCFKSCQSGQLVEGGLGAGFNQCSMVLAPTSRSLVLVPVPENHSPGVLA